MNVVTLNVRHNMEVAHRLWQLEGDKCQRIHGHSMWVELILEAHGVSSTGIAYNLAKEPLVFGDIKRAFRNHIDTNYDHHLLLHKDDPWAQTLYKYDPEYANSLGEVYLDVELQDKVQCLPGLIPYEVDPSVENIANVLARWAAQEFNCNAIINIRETHVNGATAEFRWK